MPTLCALPSRPRLTRPLIQRRGIKSFYPIEEYTGIDTMCGIGATPSLMKVKTAKVAAGSTVGFAVSYITNGNYQEYTETRPVS